MKPNGTVDVKVLPVVDHGSDQWGLPTQLSVPVARDRPIGMMSAGMRIGEVAPDGTATWRGHKAVKDFRDYGKLSDALNQATRSRSRLGVVLLDGKVSAIVLPPERARVN
jgi:hypothetical protein